MPSLGRQVSARGHAVCAACLLALVILLGVLPKDGAAHEGHDHVPPAAAAGVASGSPRIVAVSDAYQLVGIVEGEVLVIYLDRQADNAPVTSATLDVSLDGQSHKAEMQKNGTYEITSSRLKQPGTIEVLITLSDGEASDLLVGGLAIPTPVNVGGETGTGLLSQIRQVVSMPWTGGPATSAFPRLAERAGFGLVVCVTLVLGVVIGLLLSRRRRRRAGVAVAAVALVLAASAAIAHEGHDHGPDQSASSGNAPSRRPDGAIFLPKPTQRLLEVRTRIAETRTLRKSVRLTGRVVTNPNFAGVVQTTIQGRYQAPPTGVPALGAVVKAGDMLGSVVPSFAAIDSSDMAQTLGDLEQKIAIATGKLARQEQLLRTNVVARAAVDETRIELDGLVKRRVKLLEARVRAEELRAPVSGVISTVRVVSGQVVTQSDQIFQIVDPAKLLVEALVYDQVDPDAVVEATALAGDKSVKLTFIGRSRSLQQQYALLQFKIEDATAVLNVGMPVTVLAATGAPVEGLFLPRAALAQAPNGQTVVFVHKEPEVFLPRQVRADPFDAQTVLVTGGLQPGDKVVVQNAPLVAQVR